MKPPSKATLRRYGITAQQYQDILSAQGGVCGLCQRDFTGTPHVDHCHKTNAVRGILHAYCNRRRVGQHNLTSSEQLFRYLSTPPANDVLPLYHVVPVRKKRRKRRYSNKSSA